jgi:hypothetical protein
MPRNRLLVGSAIILGLLLVGTFVLIHSALEKVEKSKVLLNNSFTVQGDSYQIRGPVLIPVSGEYVASFTVSEGTIKFYPLDPPFYQMWQEGEEPPFLFEGDHADWGMSISTPSSYDMYFLFVNEDSYPKEAHLQVSRNWPETNYLGMIEGVAMMVLGSGLVAGLKMKKLHVGYLTCTYITGLAMMPLFLSIAFGEFGYLLGKTWGMSIIASLIQGTILLAALPLGALVYLWLQKGGGSAYLKSWKTGKKLRATGLLPLSGFLTNVTLVTIDNITFWNFSGTRVETPNGITRIPNPTYFALLGISCILILSGFVAFTSLWIKHHKTKINTNPNISRQPLVPVTKD